MRRLRDLLDGLHSQPISILIRRHIFVAIAVEPVFIEALIHYRNDWNSVLFRSRSLCGRICSKIASISGASSGVKKSQLSRSRSLFRARSCA